MNYKITIPEFTYVIFDLDGTLTNTMRQCADVFADISTSHFKTSRDLSRKLFLNTAGQELSAQFKNINPKTSEKELDLCVQTFWKLITNIDVQLFPGVKTFLQFLKNKNKRLFISSGLEHNLVQKRVQESGIQNYFDLSLGFSNSKPNGIKGVGHLITISQYLKIDLKELSRNSICLGDGIHDIEIAKTHKMFAIGITNTVEQSALKNAGADLVVNNYRELFKYFAESSNLYHLNKKNNSQSLLSKSYDT